MLAESKAFSGFAVKNIEESKAFYQETLGLTVNQTEMGLELVLGNGLTVFVYESPDMTPPSYTILNFSVEDLDSTVDNLNSNGIQFERYDSLPTPQDEKGILRGKAGGDGPDIAWFKDPSGNTLSVLSE